jgi:Zn-dependent peptidase ImmA (M78 family)
VVTWADAHRIAAIEAAHAHHDFGVDTKSPPIDIAVVLAAADVPLMWRAMPRLFGAYLCGASLRPGVLVNSAIPIGARRHTAAHEFGHHRLHHAATIDDGACLHVDPVETEAAPVAAGPVRWTDAEKAAEAFAAWFLMPRQAVLTAMRQLGVTRLDTATEVYQLSLILGTSYRSTVRHLPNLRLASRDRASAWMAQAPGRVKAGLDPTRTWRGRGTADLWSIDRRFDGSQILIQQGDELVTNLEAGTRVVVSGDSCLEQVAIGTTSAGSTWTSWTATDALDDRAGHLTIAAVPNPEKPGAAACWTVAIVVEAPPAGLDPHWLTRMELTR